MRFRGLFCVAFGVVRYGFVIVVDGSCEGFVVFVDRFFFFRWA